MKKLLAAFSGLAVAISLAAAPATAQAAPATVSAGTAKVGQTIADPSGKAVKVGKVAVQGKGKAYPKGHARPGVTSEKASSMMAATYFYNTAYQYPGCAGTPSVCGSEGVRAQHPILKPYVGVAADDKHSLQQIWAQSADGAQVVEVGWVVHPLLNGDNDPHLFVAAWKNGVFQGWNTSFTPVAGAAYVAGQSLDSLRGTGDKNFNIHYFDNVWWVGFNNVWFGYFNPTTTGLWAASPAVSPAFTRVGLGQTGGEVLGDPATCTDMGNGQKGKVAGAINGTASRTFNWTLLVPPTGVANSLTLQTPTNATYYDSIFNTGSVRSFYLGGPGAC